MDEMTKLELDALEKLLPGGEFLEAPYSNTLPIRKFWIGRFFLEKEWGFDISLRFLNHSKNWSMGSLNFDIFFFSLTIGPFDMFFAYRAEIYPPKGKQK